MVTVRDVARDAGVSTATVSRALNGRPGVSAHVYRQVCDSAERLGYRPNGIARSLRTVETKTVGLVISNVRNPFFTDLARAVEDAAMARGLSVILCNSDEQPEKESRYLEVLHEKRVDGILLAPARGYTADIDRVRRSGTPIVCIDRDLPRAGLPSARVDGTRAIEDLAGHLSALGHRSVAIIAGPPDVMTGRRRLDAFRRAASAAGLDLREDHVLLGDFQQRGGAVATEQLLERAPWPDVLFVSNNLMTLGALEVLQSRNVQVPGDLAVASFDDPSWFSLVDPPITAIDQPTDQLGAVALEMLIAVMEGRRSYSRTLHATLVPRRSCGER